MAALAARGLTVGAAKVGPDFIDPGYHTLATGRPGRNLDAWLCGEEHLGALAAAAGKGTDVLVVEGVMGLFDGSAQPGCDGSTAAVARMLGCPVLLVVDASAMSGSVAAVVHGFATLDPRVRVAGVVLNRVGGPGHALLLREALEPLGIPVLGVLATDDALVWRERHLGLVPIAEDPAGVQGSLAGLAAAITAGCDLNAILALARSAPRRTEAAPPTARPVDGGEVVRVALAVGPAFSFMYPENLEALRATGAELVPFDPLTDPALPEGCHALYCGGGFPEVYGPALATNEPLRRATRAALAGGLIAWAECGGFLWLCDALDDHPMVGAIPASARMTPDLTLGYREALTRVASPLGPAGTTLRGHEFHHSCVDPPGGALTLHSRWGSGTGGYASSSLFASFLHQHLGADPTPAERFVACAAGHRGRRRVSTPSPSGRRGR